MHIHFSLNHFADGFFFYYLYLHYLFLSVTSPTLGLIYILEVFLCA